MIFKRLRYYSIVAILLVALVLGFVFGGAASSSSSNVQPDLPEEVIPTPPTDTGDEEEDGGNTETLPVFKNAYSLWEYSYNIFANGAGCYAIMSGQADAAIGTQYMYAIFKRNGKVSDYANNLEISYKKGTSSFLDSSCRIVYTNADGISKRSNTKNYVWKESYVIEEEPETYTYTDKFANGERDAHDFLLDISPSTTTLVYFDRLSYDSYYEFKVVMDQDAIPSNYYNPVTSSPYVDSIPQNSINISITFRISKVNGHLLSYTLDETFEVVPAGILGVVGNQHAHNYLTYTFYEMDKAQDIEDPFAAFGY